MIKRVSRLVASRARISPLVRFSGCAGLVVALLATVAATPPTNTLSPDEQYIHIMAIIDRADALRTAGQADAARAKYLQAEKALLAFKGANPMFAPKTVAYRLKEVTDLAELHPTIPDQTNSASKGKANLEAESAPAKSNVKVVEAGAEPRSVLRFHPKAGDKQMALLTLKVKLDLPTPPAGQMGAAPQPTPNIPAISIPMDITVQSVAANGDITYQTVMGEANLVQDTNTTPEVVQGMQTALAGMKGITGTVVMSNRGVTKKSDIKAPANANPQARQFVDQIKGATSASSVELPEEAVGAGAKWDVKEQSKVQGATVDQTGSYELTALDGDKLTAKFSGSAESAGKAAASGINASVTGTATLDLSKIVASAAEIKVHTEVPMGKDKSMVMKEDITMSLDAQ